jgi:primosomal protein N' (replication factor Y) (superfamily II helicase)
MPATVVVQIVIDKPLNQGFDYAWSEEKLGIRPRLGHIVEVPFGSTSVIGVVVNVSAHSDLAKDKIKEVSRVSPLPPLDPAILRLMNFASQYYLHSLGETILPAIPQWWKKTERWEKIAQKMGVIEKPGKEKKERLTERLINKSDLNVEQKEALEKLERISSNEQKFKAVLLQGLTGSGKTAVFLNWLKTILEEKDAQALILVPEINLTPQLERRVRAYFPDKKMVVLHSGVSEKKRGEAWYDAVSGTAQIVLGTRLAALTPLANLRAIVVDEENDPSYKQQDGIRYSARDLAIWRAHDLSIPIVLSSATPSLETWMAASAGRYEYLRLDQRARGASLPNVHLINVRDPQNQQAGSNSLHAEYKNILSKPLSNAINTNLLEKKQSLVLINRRGYAPILSCQSCSWMSHCQQCSSYMVMHKPGAVTRKPVLSCHHCGLAKQIPLHCPDCGDADLKLLGQGTQKIEDAIEAIWPSARVMRLDTDVSKTSKGVEGLFQQIHHGNIDIVVGTQMIAKGHDYQNIGLVAVLDADARLFSQDFRASERLFAQLVQVAGRAGRSAVDGQASGDIYIETSYPEAAAYQYLLRHDVDGFLSYLAAERNEAKLPPFTYQALIHAESKALNKAVDFLAELKRNLRSNGVIKEGLTVYDPVPRSMMRVAGKERAQLLIESADRKSLQEILVTIDGHLRAQSQGRISKVGRIRWLIERDPISI